MKAEAEEKLFSANNSAHFFLQFFLLFDDGRKKVFLLLVIPHRGCGKVRRCRWLERDGQTSPSKEKDSGRLRGCRWPLNLSLASHLLPLLGRRLFPKLSTRFL